MGSDGDMTKNCGFNFTVIMLGVVWYARMENGKDLGFVWFLILKTVLILLLSIISSY